MIYYYYNNCLQLMLFGFAKQDRTWVWYYEIIYYIELYDISLNYTIHIIKYNNVLVCY